MVVTLVNRCIDLVCLAACHDAMRRVPRANLDSQTRIPLHTGTGVVASQLVRTFSVQFFSANIDTNYV